MAEHIFSHFRLPFLRNCTLWLEGENSAFIHRTILHGLTSGLLRQWAFTLPKLVSISMHVLVTVNCNMLLDDKVTVMRGAARCTVSSSSSASPEAATEETSIRSSFLTTWGKNQPLKCYHDADQVPHWIKSISTLAGTLPILGGEL